MATDRDKEFQAIQLQLMCVIAGNLSVIAKATAATSDRGSLSEEAEKISQEGFAAALRALNWSQEHDNED